MDLNLASSRNCPICYRQGTKYLDFEKQTLYRCSGCGSLFYWPYPQEGWTLTYEALESCPFYIERGADLLFYSHIVDYVREILAVSEGVGNGTPVKVLEVGCSYGFLIDIARRLLGWEVEGVDPNSCAGLGGAELGLRIEQARVEDMSGKNLYDVVISVESIEHVPRPLEHLQVMTRLLRDDGFLLLTTPDAARGDLGPHLWPGEHYVIFSQTGLERLLRDAGLVHFSFFRVAIPEIVAVVASRKPLPSAVPAICNASRLDAVAAGTVTYLQSKIAEGPQQGLLSRGLYFRLFELLVNQGRYGEAEAIEQKVDRLLGFDGDGNGWSLIEPVVRAMEAAKDSHSYLQAGPACLAPYLFYKGMLTLNHKKDCSEAAKFFGGAARLLRREVTDFDLTHFRTFLLASESHEDIAALAAGQSLPIRTSTLHDGAPYALVAPWFRGGVEEFRSHVSGGPMERRRIAGGSSVVFTVLCRDNNLSAFALNLAPFAKTNGEPISLTLTVSERNDLSVLRRAVIKVKPAACDRVPSDIHEAFEAFSFAPIAQSRGKQLTLRLDVPPELAHVTLLCWAVQGESSIVAEQAVGNLIPIAIPYFATWDSSARSGPSTMAMELVTVLVATRDNAGSIRRTLDSIMVQDYPRLESVVVDRNSSDGTADHIRREYPQVNLLALNEEVGINQAYNMGMSVAKGELVLVLEEGVLADRAAVSRLVEIIALSRNIGLVGWSSASDESCSENADVFFLDRRLVASERLLARESFMAAPSPRGFLMRRSVADDLGHLFDERLSMPWASRELGLRCWLQGFACLHVPLSGVQSRPTGAPDWTADKDEASRVNAALVVLFRTLGMRCFARAALKILAGSKFSARIRGSARFLASIGEHRLTRRVLQERRRVSDTHLQVLAGGIRPRIPWSEVEEQEP